jgi:hypothetical protein
LTCDYQGDDMQIDTTRVFLLKCWLIYSRIWLCLKCLCLTELEFLRLLTD